MVRSVCAFCLLFVVAASMLMASERPNIVFVMADDMGWGQTGYRGHPILKTPNLDAMAASGLRFERFYAGCPALRIVVVIRTNDELFAAN